jgi:hypothetical protein
MEQVIKYLILYVLFLVITSYTLKYFHGKGSENSILEYKIDIYLNRIRQDIIDGFHKNPEKFEVVEGKLEPRVKTSSSETGKISSSSPFLNSYHLINNPLGSVDLKTVQTLTDTSRLHIIT